NLSFCVSKCDSRSGDSPSEYRLAALYASVLEQICASDEPINEPINEKEKQVPNYLRENPQSTKEQIATAIGQSRSSVTRHIQALMAAGALRRIGSNKTGYWEVI
ncbi:winged helix-turn-helix transcriptional regulator, partial [Gordonibacter sp.]|uniref:winged helix-turn-helix transcriptional regulator n=1 Tax=Gordonibacter sp. TaxID=1968902 RepID=UPI002FC5A2C1